MGSERHGAEGVEIGAGGDVCTEEGRGLVAGHWNAVLRGL